MLINKVRGNKVARSWRHDPDSTKKKTNHHTHKRDAQWNEVESKDSVFHESYELHLAQNSSGKNKRQR